MAKKSKTTAKATKSRLVAGVHITAELRREGETPPGYYRQMAGVRLDKNGNLVGVASCGDEAFVCTGSQIPQLIDFLAEVVEASAA